MKSACFLSDFCFFIIFFFFFSLISGVLRDSAGIASVSDSTLWDELRRWIRLPDWHASAVSVPPASATSVPASTRRVSADTPALKAKANKKATTHEGFMAMSIQGGLAVGERKVTTAILLLSQAEPERDRPHLPRFQQIVNWAWKCQAGGNVDFQR